MNWVQHHLQIRTGYQNIRSQGPGANLLRGTVGSLPAHVSIFRLDVSVPGQTLLEGAEKDLEAGTTANAKRIVFTPCLSPPQGGVNLGEMGGYQTTFEGEHFL